VKIVLWRKLSSSELSQSSQRIYAKRPSVFILHENQRWTYVDDSEHQPSRSDGFQRPGAVQVCTGAGLPLVDVLDAVYRKDDEDREEET
jgi:hypothetical protein